MFQQSLYEKEIYYSRQAAALGWDTQDKLEQLDCFIYGLRGLGLEIAKNLILMGLKRIVIYDKTILSISDLGTNFYANANQVDKVTREKAVIQSLKALNDNVIVDLYDGIINGQNLSEFSVVVMTDMWDQELISEINEATRKKGNGFILAHSSGLFGSIFVDFSDNFVIENNNGQTCKEYLIEEITKNQNGVVHTIDTIQGLQDGDYVQFKEVLGMTEVNDSVFKIITLSPNRFSIGDTTKFQAYQRNGKAIQIKFPQNTSYKSFKNMLSFENKNNLDRSLQLQISYNSILTFMNQNGRLPNLLNHDDADLVLKLALKITKEQYQLDIQLIRNIAQHLQAQIAPLTSFWGGLVAFEVIKFTGKFTPIKQWLHLEFYEALPEIEVNKKSKNCQYDDYYAIFGQETMEKLQNQNVLLMGIGGLGNEYLKIFSLMGIGSGQKGSLITVDNDQIEVSNLNRQFLFSKHHIGSNKANVACAVINQINQSIQCKAYPYAMSKESEQIFNQSFWNQVDFTVNAVDNIRARHYMDSQCCYYSKPNFESGSEGTQCHSQVILPYQTESFSEFKDRPEMSSPKSTFMNFPYTKDHNIEWALEYFNNLFEKASKDLYQLSQNPQTFLNTVYNQNQRYIDYLKDQLELIEKYVLLVINPTLENLVRYAKELFSSLFDVKIKYLLSRYPADFLQQNGLLFWTNPRRLPMSIEFNSTDPLHCQFIHSVVKIVIKILGQQLQFDSEQISFLVGSIDINKNKELFENLQFNENEIKQENDMRMIKLEKLVQENILNMQQIRPFSYQKDKLSCVELEFITSAANLRGINYNIPPASRQQVRERVECIIPQLITTKSAITGIVGIEILKNILQKNIKYIRNTYINLAIPTFIFAQPKPPYQNVDQEFNQQFLDRTIAVPKNWTSWDRIRINKKMTVGGLIEYFEQKYNVNVQIIGFNQHLIYSKFKKSSQELLTKDCADLYAKVSKEKLPEDEISFDVILDSYQMINGQEVSVDFPLIKYHYRV
ncbi:unnamed protein product (macronuclear) [Paramecium tetraurelia]|uniref:Ubiquitin-activating enzyme E1 C-terminal domain-containing protein n=1 Tax=Paramecium tetraurelia TaxID=5888 RepID=A0C799_PARTE|nr:uncharacterized protein GSPATT00035796001 [Paramecium tetraurelia]CAK66666.1 unnamed protein product [Paramecium tetraurelia]|eukprot:XP_001434063.1 hypothetical protein (macronuclear) [Paramecium tetraurelia strain d4-2]